MRAFHPFFCIMLMKPFLLLLQHKKWKRINNNNTQKNDDDDDDQLSTHFQAGAAKGHEPSVDFLKSFDFSLHKKIHTHKNRREREICQNEKIRKNVLMRF